MTWVERILATPCTEHPGGVGHPCNGARGSTGADALVCASPIAAVSEIEAKRAGAFACTGQVASWCPIHGYACPGRRP